ncbi:hypothetical protein [Azotobacter beijerinckii]|uniref:hypothetical protein n=1 Tax=Azotobacter beijerinckii TaxID=170623 RepID=UPI00295579D4|nr:hypothetical protein [Azotobacter beijerinckii]MDV7213562.1 hypothetical protein [Azotobacter beijerinckii]
MAGASHLIARLAARPVTPVTPFESPRLPLEAPESLAVTPVTSVTPKSGQGRDENPNPPPKTGNPGGVARDLPFREKSDYRGYQKGSQPEPQAPLPTEPRSNAWTITRGGKPICTMVDEPSTRTEALAEARWRWPDADILEN